MQNYEILGLVVLPTLVAFAGIILLWNRRLAAENQRQASAQQPSAVLEDRLPVSVFEFERSPDGRIVHTFLNQSARRMLRVDSRSSEAKRTSFTDFVHPDDVSAVTRSFESSMVSGEPIRGSFRYRLPDEQWGWIFAETSAPVQRDGVSVWTGYWFDLSSERNVNLALSHSLLSRNDLVTSAGNQFLAPIGSLTTALDSLVQSGLDAAQSRLVGKALDAVRILDERVDRLLDLSRIESHELALNETEVNLRALLAPVTDAHQAIAARRGLRFDCEIDEAVPELVVCDPRRLGQVVSMLLGNAFGSTTDGFVRFTLKTEATAAAGHPDVGVSTRLKFLVQDSSDGDPARLPPSGSQTLAVDEPLPAGRQDIDLSLARRLADLMGGRVLVRNTPGVGTQLEFSVPAVLPGGTGSPSGPPDQQAGKRVAIRRQQESSPTGNAQERPILIVDDNRLARMMTSALLEESGFVVHLAENHTEALERCEHNNYRAVITDYRMPGANGLELAMAIRQLATRKSAAAPALLLLTAGVMDEELAKVKAVFDLVLIKPVNTARLVEAIVSIELAGV